jgi:hypothetical protein
MPGTPGCTGGNPGAVALASLIVGLHVETAWVRATTSGTFDETVYRQVAHDHDIVRRGTVRPAVDLGVAPLPLLLAWLPGVRAEPTDETYVDQVAAARHRATWLFGVPLVVTAFLWCATAQGWFAGTVAAGLLVLSPNILAHASLATTDACLRISMQPPAGRRRAIGCSRIPIWIGGRIFPL